MIKSPHATRFTLYGERNMTNRKPYRTRAQKGMAKSGAVRSNGRFTSHASKSYHNEQPYNPSKTAQRHYARFVADCSN